MYAYRNITIKLFYNIFNIFVAIRFSPPVYKICEIYNDQIIFFNLSIVFVVISCGPPAKVANAKQSGFDFSYGSTVTYTCTSGYTPAHAATMSRVCRADGQWDGATPICTRKYHMVTREVCDKTI